ncbi:MAG: helix-turn-helix domain-containing protein [Bacteroidales bacterium]|jgi:AraC-like DNA-binding protein
MIRFGAAIKIIKKLLYLSGLLEEEIKEHSYTKISDVCKKTENAIETKKLYLNPGFTIAMLAKEIGTNRTYLSRYISGVKRCRFTDYINNLRAEHAKSLLQAPGILPLADIAMISGFGSVRAMNRSFLKNYGKLPATVRKEYLTLLKFPLCPAKTCENGNQSLCQRG